VDILGVRTLTTAIYRAWFSMFDPTLAAQLAMIAALLPLLLVGGYALLTRGRGFASPPNRPRPPRRMPLSARAGAFAAAACTLPVLLGFGLPLLMLLVWASGVFAVMRLESLYADVASTLLVATATAASTMILGAWLALHARAIRASPWSSAPLWVLSLNFALPAIVLAIALLFLTGWTYTTSLGSALADSLAMILLATTLRFAVIAHFSAESGLRGLSRRLDESVRCTGRGSFHGLLRVLLPQLREPLMVGGLLVFVMAARELTLSLVLQPFGYGSLALSVHHYAKLDLYGPASVYALCLALVLLYPVLSLERRLARL
jgi:iron(III) transport system permease protein